MKILFFIHNLNIGGAEMLATRYLINLKKNGLDVVLVEENTVKTDLRKELIDNGIKVYTLFKLNFSNRLYEKVYRIVNPTNIIWKKIINNEKPDVVHLHTNLDNYYCNCFPASKTVYTFHSNVQRSLKNNSNNNENKIKRLSQGGMSFIAISQRIKTEIGEIFGTNRIEYIPNGVNIEIIKEQKYDLTKFKQELQIPNNAMILGHVGRFDRVKNHERILDIFSCLLKDHPEWYLVLVGDGTKVRRDELIKLSHKLGVFEHIRMLGIRNDATKIMSCFDSMILTSISESFSLVLIEAQAHGISCITSNVVPQEVVCNENCYSLSLDLPNCEWVKKIIKGSKNKSEPSELLKSYSMESVITKMINLYSKMCKE